MHFGAGVNTVACMQLNVTCVPGLVGIVSLQVLTCVPGLVGIVSL